MQKCCSDLAESPDNFRTWYYILLVDGSYCTHKVCGSQIWSSVLIHFSGHSISHTASCLCIFPRPLLFVHLNPITSFSILMAWLLIPSWLLVLMPWYLILSWLPILMLWLLILSWIPVLMPWCLIILWLKILMFYFLFLSCLPFLMFWLLILLWPLHLCFDSSFSHDSSFSCFDSSWLLILMFWLIIFSWLLILMLQPFLPRWYLMTNKISICKIISNMIVMFRPAPSFINTPDST